MTTEHSTYTYETGEQETVTLKRGPATPPSHALLKIEYSDGGASDCYVDLAWLRDRADQLAQQRPEGAEKVEAVLHQYWSGDINGDDLADRIAEEMNR